MRKLCECVDGAIDRVSFERMGEFIRPLHATLWRDSRATERRKLSLVTQVGAKEESSDARIHDLSETGLMFETVAQLSVGEILLVELPFIGTTEARVVWQKENSYGCEFLTPVSQATVSAALLKSSVDLPGEGIESTLEEVPVGISPSLEDMTNWEVEFERTRGAIGYRLIGFRQTTEGMFIALVTKTN